MSTSLEISREGRLRRLTLNRAEKRNALNAELTQALHSSIEEAEEDASCGAILIAARGAFFCAGMDLEEVLDPEAHRLHGLHEKLFSIGAKSRKPIVAAIHAPALGGGVGLIAQAHVALAAQGVTFGFAELRIGMWPFMIFRSIVNAIGERRAVELALTTRIFSAADALQWGLIHEVVPPFELEDRAEAVARQLAESSAEAVSWGLSFVEESRSKDQRQAGELAVTFRSESFRSADFEEGVRAFREKRKPDWPSLAGSK